jgi:hypothetical protein
MSGYSPSISTVDSSIVNLIASQSLVAIILPNTLDELQKRASSILETMTTVCDSFVTTLSRGAEI